MQKATSKLNALKFDGVQKTWHFNFNKLQAVLCMAASAAVSVGLITWAVSRFL